MSSSGVWSRDIYVVLCEVQLSYFSGSNIRNVCTSIFNLKRHVLYMTVVSFRADQTRKTLFLFY
jgi:hypothetical protein